jgi:serine/threonine protein kinase
VANSSGKIDVVTRRGSVDAKSGGVFMVKGVQYTVVRTNARSETAVVLKAEKSDKSDDLLAIKCLAISKLDPQALRKTKRFIRQQKMHSKLHHENIVKLVDIGRTSDSFPFMAMEYVNGAVPLEYLRGAFGKLPLNYFVEVFSRVCDGLTHAHQQGIVHNDLSPNDILIGKSGRDDFYIKLTDFGKGNPLIHSDNEEEQLTRNCDLFGHPEYMSPEGIKAQPLDARSNIFSLGCIMYLVLSEENPFRGNNWAAILINKMHAKAPQLPLIEAEPALTADLNIMLMKCMERQPENRFQSTEELKHALSHLGVCLSEPLSHSRIRQAVVKKSQ